MDRENVAMKRAPGRANVAVAAPQDSLAGMLAGCSISAAPKPAAPKPAAFKPTRKPLSAVQPSGARPSSKNKRVIFSPDSFLRQRPPAPRPAEAPDDSDDSDWAPGRDGGGDAEASETDDKMSVYASEANTDVDTPARKSDMSMTMEDEDLAWCRDAHAALERAAARTPQRTEAEARYVRSYRETPLTGESQTSSYRPDDDDDDDDDDDESCYSDVGERAPLSC